MFSFNAMAQDVILKKDGSEINAKVLEITDTQIKYKDFDFQDGPVRNINNAEVFMIIYENGKREIFNKPTETAPQNDKKQHSEAKEENEQSTISVCGLVVACSDASDRMTWDEAKYKAPKGYRLPTPDELKCMRNSLKSTNCRLPAREYWTSEDAVHGNAYTVTMNDGKEEKNKRSDKFFVRYVKIAGYEDKSNNSEQIHGITSQQIETHYDMPNNKPVYIPKEIQSRKDVIVARFNYVGFQTKITGVNNKYIYYKKNGDGKNKKIKQKKVAYTLSFNEKAKQENYPSEMNLQEFMSLPIYISNNKWVVFGTNGMDMLPYVRRTDPGIHKDYSDGLGKIRSGNTLSAVGGVIFPSAPLPGTVLSGVGSSVSSSGSIQKNNAFMDYFRIYVNLKTLDKYGIVITPYKENPLTF